MSITELRPRAKPLVAAAFNLADGVVSKDLLKQLKRHQAWQLDAAGYFSEIGEVHYIVNRAAAALSEARLYAAATSPETGQLVPVEDPEAEIPAGLADAATEEVARLRSPVGGQSQLIHQSYVNAEIAGEFFLVETPEDGDAGYWVRSVLETKIGDEGEPVEIKGVGRVPFESVSRVWRPHPMRFESADSGMRPVLGACELVILIDRHFRAAMRSRLFAGLLLLPNSFRQGVPDNAEQGEPRSDPAVQDLLDALSEGIQEEGTASAVVPNFLYGAADDIAAAKLLDLGQRIDAGTLELRTESIERIVQGLEYPPEIVTGTGDINHWGAWFIGDDFINHVRPKGNFLADAFTTVFLRPGLEARGYASDDVGRVQLAFDYSPLQRKPNIVETATAAWDRIAISDASYRRDLGYDDGDAPSEDEVAARLQRSPLVVAELLRQGQSASQAAGEAAGGEITTGEPASGAVAASVPSETVGGRLARLDIELTERLVGALVATTRRALERAGNRAKAKVASAHRDAVRNVHPGDVCAHLGPTLLAAAGLTDDELLDGDVDELESDFRRWTRDAAFAALAVLGIDATDVVAARVAATVDAAWEWMRNALRSTLSRVLATGRESLSEANLRSIARQALAAAGGATELSASLGVTVPSTAVTGVGTGPLILDALVEAGGDVAGWRWVHDDPAHPFPPHVALDGAEAATIEEFGIGFGGWPGDHAGCLCLIEPIIRRPE